MKNNLLLLAACCICTQFVSAQECDQPVNLDSIDYENSGVTFRSYKPTQFLRVVSASAIMPDYGHFQMNLSPEFHFIKNKHFLWGLVYNCEYSFYMDNLYSGPVLSRLQNPFAYAEWYFGEDMCLRTADGSNKKQKKHRIGLAVAHESNGMILDDSAIYNSFTGSHSPVGNEESQYHNYNSMGWNYFGVHYRQKLKGSCWGAFAQGEVGFEYRLYTNQSFGIGEKSFWDLENHLFLDRSTTGLSQTEFNKITIRNYDGIRFYIFQEACVPRKKAGKEMQKVRFFYQLHTGLPVNDEWGSASAYKLTHKYEISYGWHWNKGWGSIFVLAGHDEGFKAYLSSYPCFRSLWYLGLQMGF